MKIKNINIKGGKQQFAKNIYNTNGYENIEKQLVLLSNNDEEIVSGLNTLKSDTSTEEEKKKSGNLIRKFLENGAGEAGKVLVTEILNSGVEYIKYFV